LPEGFDAGVDEETDVALGELGDAADFPVTESVLKFEANDFALIGRQVGEGVLYVALRLSRHRGGGWRGFIAGARGEIDVGERGKAAFFAVNVERAVPANGEEPGRQVAVETFGSFSAEAQECVLHYVAGAVEVAGQLDSVAEQGTFVLIEDGVEPLAARGLVVAWHVVSLRITREAEFS